jgi:hypothetical protein
MITQDRMETLLMIARKDGKYLDIKKLSEVLSDLVNKVEALEKKSKE